MKKIALLLSLLVLFAAEGKAVSAYPGLIDYRQPDGSLIKIRMMGDEFLHWAETEDGYTLLSDEDGFMTLAMPDKSGDLKPSIHRLTAPSKVTPQFLDAKSKLPGKLAFSARQIANAAEMVKAGRTDILKKVSKAPVTGTRKFLVILVQTPDVKFQKTSNDFDRLMNEKNYKTGGNVGSVRDFYDENSFGQLDLQSDVTEIYTVSQNMAYYGNNASGKPYYMAIEALIQAAEDYNLKDYDTDNDGYLDGVHFIFAGHGEEAGGGDDCIWSHQLSTSGYLCQADGVKMNKYSCSPELRGASGNDMTYIGVICHEIGHVLGTMDFYDTNYSVGGQYSGTGSWDLMASGNWNGNGASPAHFNPYSKIYDFGWSDVQDGNVASQKTLHAKTKGDFVRINTQTEGEFFLLECRSQSGFDQALPGHGMLVYRSSGSMSKMSANTMNATHPQQFYLVSANAKESIPTSSSSSYGTVNSSSAPFPGTSGKTEFTDATAPSMKDWDGKNTSYPITDITESDGAVSFNIAGGNGLAYNFHVESASTSQLKLEWNNDSGIEVLLVYNTEETFGTPEDITYTAGQTLGGGGTVLYDGNGTAFTHSDLIGGQKYYYRLYTKSQSGTWAGEQNLSVRTPVGVISTFPYSEDFSSGTLDGSWSFEYVYGTNDWTVGKLFNLSDYSLNFDWAFEKGTRQSTRVVMPAIDFSGHDCAYLEFDYRNMLIGMDVVYRSSPSESWQLLKQLDNHYLSSQMSLQQAIDAETHTVIPLHNLSSTYQIAFVSDFYWRGNSKSSIEIGCVDDVSIVVDYDVKVCTGKAEAVSNSWADVAVSVNGGLQTVTSYGVEWSQNQSSWNSVPAAEASGTVHLASLPINTTVYYRAYAVTGSGTFYGETLSFKTLSFSKGSGTDADPFVISSSSDWTTLSGLTITSGLHFMLGASFSMSPSIISNTFDGHIDGKGETITISSNSSASLFENVGKDAVIENLNITCNLFNTTGSWSSLLVLYNYGTIKNCNFRVEELKMTGSRNFGGATVKNYGVISHCSSYIYMPIENTYGYGGSGSFCNQAWVGGLCWYNFNIIDHCSFNGHLSSNNNSNLGGITALNYYEDDQQRGIITNCINRGTIQIVTVNSKAWAIAAGGISGGNYGDIRYCVNEGSVNAQCSSSDAHAGGILGSSSKGSVVAYCISRGNMNVSSTDSGAGCGGIQGFSDRGEISNCVFTGKITVVGTSYSCFNAIAGTHRSDNVHDCYYSSTIADSYATKVSDWTGPLNTINGNAGFKCMLLSDSKPVLSWETGYEPLYLVLHDITDITATSISGLFTSSADMVECGIYYKTEEAETWDKLEADTSLMRHSFKLEGLNPMTSYSLKAFAVGADGTTLSTAVQIVTTDFANAGTEQDPYLIGSLDDLKNFARIVNQGNTMTGKYVKLTDNIDMQASQGVTWLKLIGQYDGDFNGNGYSIHNFRMTSTDNDTYQGFIASGSSYIHDLHFYDADVSFSRTKSPFHVGAIAGSCSRMERCSFVGNMTFSYGSSSWTSPLYAGGLAGEASSTVKDCYALMQVSTNATKYFGGIVGQGSASSCYFAISSNQTVQTQLAGMVGPDSTATDCYYLVGTMSAGETRGTSMILTNMKNGTLLGYLTAGVWCDNINGDKLNGGFPVLSCQKCLPEISGEDPVIDTSEVIVFADANVKSICVSHWDINKDGELSRNEAAAVTDIGTFFARNDVIKSFDELQYFTGLTSISESAFDCCRGLTSVVIPENVTIIRDNAFSVCGLSNEIVIPDKVTELGEYAFSHCGTASSVKFSKALKIIGGQAFYACSGFETVEIPETVTNIGEEAFSDCSKLRKVFISSSVGIIGRSAFSRTPLLDTVIVSEGNPIYDSRNNCNAIIETATDRLIAGCRSTTIPHSVKALGNESFLASTEMPTMKIPHSVVMIEGEAFMHCWKMKSVQIPTSVTAIGKCSFSYCYGLLMADLPKTLTSVPDYAFYDNSKMTDVYVHWTEPGSISMGTRVFNSTYLPAMTLHVPKGTVPQYQSAATWKDFGRIVDDAEDGDCTLESQDSQLKDMDNVVYVESQRVYRGHAMTVALKMKNSVTATGFQVDVCLPQGLSYVLGNDGKPIVKLNNARVGENTVDAFTSVVHADGNLRIFCHTTEFEAISGSDGEVATFDINVPDSLNDGDLPLILREVEVFDNTPKCCRHLAFKSTLSVSALTLGDANADGRVTVSDFTAVANHILDIPNENFEKIGADVNNDGKIDAADLTGTVNILLYDTPAGMSVVGTMQAEADADARFDIPEFSLQGGETASVVVSVCNPGVEFSAFQFDVKMPYGLVLKEASLSLDRTESSATDFFEWRQLQDGTCRVLCASTTGRKFRADHGGVAVLTFEAAEGLQSEEGVLDVCNALIACDARCLHLPDVKVGFSVSSATETVTPHAGNQSGMDDVFNILGQRVTGDYRGVVIRNGKVEIQK